MRPRNPKHNDNACRISFLRFMPLSNNWFKNLLISGLRMRY